MKKVALAALVALVLTAIVGYATLIAPKHTPEGCTYTIDLPKLRELAGPSGPKEIRVEGITSAYFPRAVATVGEPWDRVEFRVYSYQLVFDDQTIIVDTAMSREQATELSMLDDYDDAAMERVKAAMQRATAIYVTHEHADHMGGAVLAQYPGLRLTNAQLNSGTPNMPAITEAARSTLRTFDYESLNAAAPGVVLLKARGHTAGSQMVYVRRSDGKEVILTGDTAWLMANVEREQGPVRLAAVMMKSARNENACQLVALHKVQNEVAIMPGHDKARMAELLSAGTFTQGVR